MGYTTDFEGSIKIIPALPAQFIAQVNEIASKRNNTYGDGDAGSFDGTLFGKKKPTEQRQLTWEEYQESINPHPHRENKNSSVPSCWCQWTLKEGDQCTYIVWDGVEKFYEYGFWLQFLIDYIVDRYPSYKFEGKIEWIGESEIDTGIISIIQLIQKPTVKMVFTIDADRRSKVLFPSPLRSISRAQYALVAYPSEGEYPTAVIERKETVLLPADNLSATSPSLCLLSAMSLTSQSRERGRKLLSSIHHLQPLLADFPPRHCSGCGEIFSHLSPLIWGHVISANGWAFSYVTERYCSGSCFPKECPCGKGGYDVCKHPRPFRTPEEFEQVTEQAKKRQNQDDACMLM